MIDEQLRSWLIEVNTNPCLEETSALLREYIPRMLDDAFKLTLDVLYPPPQESLGENNLPIDSQISLDPPPINNRSKFKVSGVPDDVIMW